MLKLYNFNYIYNKISFNNRKFIKNLMSDDEDDSPDTIKAIILGETGVGKTNLINAVKGVNFNQNTESTITMNCLKKTMIIYEQNYKIKIWDTAGQEKFRALNKLYYKDAKVVLLVYDITNKKSFDALREYWLNEIKTALGDEPVLGLVGNKTDLSNNKEVGENEAQKFAEDNNLKFKLCSSKDDPKNFNLFLRSLVKEYIKKRKKDKKIERFELEKYEEGGQGSCISL